jgi:hypothetical protein
MVMLHGHHAAARKVRHSNQNAWVISGKQGVGKFSRAPKVMRVPPLPEHGASPFWAFGWSSGLLHFLPYGQQNLHITTCGSLGSYLYSTCIRPWFPNCTVLPGGEVKNDDPSGQEAGTSARRVSRPVKPAATVSPTESEIATVTYRLWPDNGCPVGSHEEDWFRAEAMLKNALVAKCEDSWAAGVVRDGKNERNRPKEALGV